MSDGRYRKDIDHKIELPFYKFLFITSGVPDKSETRTNFICCCIFRITCTVPSLRRSVHTILRLESGHDRTKKGSDGSKARQKKEFGFSPANVTDRSMPRDRKRGRRSGTRRHPTFFVSLGFVDTGPRIPNGGDEAATTITAFQNELQR